MDFYPLIKSYEDVVLGLLWALSGHVLSLCWGFSQHTKEGRVERWRVLTCITQIKPRHLEPSHSPGQHPTTHPWQTTTNPSPGRSSKVKSAFLKRLKKAIKKETHHMPHGRSFPISFLICLPQNLKSKMALSLLPLISRPLLPPFVYFHLFQGTALRPFLVLFPPFLLFIFHCMRNTQMRSHCNILKQHK